MHSLMGSPSAAATAAGETPPAEAAAAATARCCRGTAAAGAPAPGRPDMYPLDRHLLADSAANVPGGGGRAVARCQGGQRAEIIANAFDGPAQHRFSVLSRPK